MNIGIMCVHVRRRCACVNVKQRHGVHVSVPQDFPMCNSDNLSRHGSLFIYTRRWLVLAGIVSIVSLTFNLQNRLEMTAGLYQK